MKLLKKVLICIAMSSLLSVVLMILYTGSDKKTKNKLPASFWGAIPPYLISTFMSIRYECKHRLLVKQADSTLWEVCRDMDQGIILDTPRYADCTVFVAVSSSNKIDKNLINNFKTVFERCEIVKFDVGAGETDLLTGLSDSFIEQSDIELLKIDITEYNWSSFEDVLDSDVLDNVNQLLLRIDMADVKDEERDERTIGAMEMSGFEKKHHLLRNLPRLGFTLTFSNYIPQIKTDGSKSLCCYYGTWVKLHKETKLLTEDNSKVLEWQPVVRVFADGHNETFQTPFRLQPLAVFPEVGKTSEWDSEVKRLLKFIRTNQVLCKESHHVGHKEDGGWDVCFEPDKGLNSVTKCLVY